MITTFVEAATAEVEMTNEPVNELAGTVVVAGTLATLGLLLDSEITASAAGPADITMVPLELSPPATVVGLMSTFVSAAAGGGVCAVKLRTADQAPAVARRVDPADAPEVGPGRETGRREDGLGDALVTLQRCA